MNPFEIPGHTRFSLDAGAAVTEKRFLKVNTSGKVEHATAATEPIVGVAYVGATTADRPVSIVADGIAMVTAGESITAGDLVAPGSDGKAMKTGGMFPALTSGESGEDISVLLHAVSGGA